MLPVEPILVEIARGAVRCGDHHHAPVDQPREQPGEDHRIGGVVDDHFVKAKQLRLGRDGIHHGRNGIARFLLSLFTQRSEEHTSELQSLMRTSYAVFCLKKKKTYQKTTNTHTTRYQTT